MNIKMNRRVKEKWVEALRSGEHQQVKDKLEVPSGGRCCLGVLCYLAVEDGLNLNVQVYDQTVTYDGVEATPPRNVVRWAGTESANPMIRFRGNDGQYYDYTLTHLNDTGLTFDQIADLIEYFL